MKLCIVGSSGHYHYVLDPVRCHRDLDLEIAGIAPGSEEENIEGLTPGSYKAGI